MSEDSIPAQLALIQADGLRVHRTFSTYRPVTIDPLGAARVMQEDVFLRAQVGVFLRGQV